jgi:hypothetical protein
MFTRRRSKEHGSSRKISPPSASYMDNNQFGKLDRTVAPYAKTALTRVCPAAYLADLRNKRVNRPGGERPRDSINVQAPEPPSLSGRSSLDCPPKPAHMPTHQRTQSELPRVASGRSYGPASVSSRYSTVDGEGRDYYPSRPARPLKPSEVVGSATYIERGQRWMEKEEAVSLRQAMHAMDLKDTPEEPEEAADKQLYDAALNEASELVWQHQNSQAQRQPGAPYRYKQHLRQNSYAHARTASAGRYGDNIVPSGLARNPASRSVSGSSTGSDQFSSVHSRTSIGSNAARDSFEESREVSGDQRPNKSYGSLSGPPLSMSNHRRRSSMKRNISGEVSKPFSGDQIWEDPEGATPEKRMAVGSTREEIRPLRIKPKDPMNRVQFAPDVPNPESPEAKPRNRLSKFDIHHNPPTQSRNPQYRLNSPPAEGTSPLQASVVPKKHGMELRGEDIREATSMRLRDRSPKLPTPTAVSDSPGRPIVSFDAEWKEPEVATDAKPEDHRRVNPIIKPSSVQRGSSSQVIPAISITPDSAAPAPVQPSGNARGPLPPPPSIQITPDPSPSRPPIPTISVDDGSPSIPTIVLPGDDEDHSMPVISVSGETSSSSTSRRPLPTPDKSRSRVVNARPRGHWSPVPAAVGNRATARCHECMQPIEGRFVSLAGSSERFHPQCFSCYCCGTSLEALEISPEPDNYRAARLQRIKLRASGEILEELPGETMAEDGDERLRFYCHLDWHELFAPRCKHCHTPIMGEHVVALGEHWHNGHFFCAECGDPFEHGMTHIEKDGYAWCVSCQTKRTERRAPKCKKCKKPVIGQYVQALGGEWHDECFRCRSCGGTFDDGQIFPCEDAQTGDMVVHCTRCREMELKR